jgi:hypothetical protein
LNLKLLLTESLCRKERVSESLAVLLNEAVDENLELGLNKPVLDNPEVAPRIDERVKLSDGEKGLVKTR